MLCMERLHTCAFDERVERVQEWILCESYRCAQGDTRAWRARVHADTGREVKRETEPGARDGVREADRASDGGDIEAGRLAMESFLEQKCTRALYAPRH
jgi:hypothetical protein